VGDSPDINVLLLSASTLLYFKLLYSGYQSGNDIGVRYLHGMNELAERKKKYTITYSALLRWAWETASKVLMLRLCRIVKLHNNTLLHIPERTRFGVRHQQPMVSHVLT
jgi:hypothetical protein